MQNRKLLSISAIEFILSSLLFSSASYALPSLKCSSEDIQSYSIVLYNNKNAIISLGSSFVQNGNLSCVTVKKDTKEERVLCEPDETAKGTKYIATFFTEKSGEFKVNLFQSINEDYQPLQTMKCHVIGLS